MQLNAFRHSWTELLPDGGDQIFDGTHLPLHEIHVQVEVAMIQLVDDMPVYDGTEFLDIIDESGVRIRPSLDGDRQFEIVTMPVFIGAASEDLLVPLLGPLGVIQFMCRVEMLDPGQIDHDVR